MNLNRLGKLMLSLVLFLAFATAAPAQFPFGGKGGGGSKGGGGKGGGMSFDPEEMFKRMSNGKDYIDINGLSPWMRGGLEKYAKENGITSGKITRDQYLKYSEDRKKTFQQGGGGGFPGKGGGGFPGGAGGAFQGGGGPGGKGPSGGPPGGGNGGPPMVLKGGPPQKGSSDNKGDNGKPGDRDKGGKGGGRDDDKKQLSPEELEAKIKRDAEEYFKDRDDNKDGQLNTDEMSRTLREHYKKFDGNNDNMINREEVIAYMTAFRKGEIDWRNNNNGNNDNKKSGSSNGPSTTNITIDLAELDERPTVFTGGKYPDGLPEWFIPTDTDKDGQIGLYEWVSAKKDMQEFKDMDRNQDSFLTAEEAIYFQKQPRPVVSSAADGDSPGAPSASENGQGKKSYGNGSKGGKSPKGGKR